MTRFFIGENNRLELFGALHIMTLAGAFAAYALIIAFRERLRAFGHYGALGKIFAAILFTNMAVHYGSRIITGTWSVGEDLPLHICFITNFLMMYIMYTGNKNGLYRVVYYFTLIGPLPAIVWPDLRGGPESWIFWQFIISHHVMLGFSVYCIAVFGWGTDARGAAEAFAAGNVYTAVMAVFNRIAGTNYVMLGGLPEQIYERYPIMGNLPPAVWLEAAGIAALLAALVAAKALGAKASPHKS